MGLINAHSSRILLAPGSPWWLEKNGRPAKARVSIRRMTDCDGEEAENMFEYIRSAVLGEEARKEPNMAESVIWEGSGEPGPFWRLLQGRRPPEDGDQLR